MFDWISSNSSIIQAVATVLMAAVWVVYLPLILSSLLRERRTQLVISLGAGAGLRARCLVSNLSLAPVYLVDVLVTLRGDHGETDAIITDRNELKDEDVSNPAEATNQGPLRSGDSRDIGSFSQVLRRAVAMSDPEQAMQGVREVEITAIVVTAASNQMAAATRRYTLERKEENEIKLRPHRLTAAQIRAPWSRRRLRRRLKARVL
jgi:hypothetical protein